MKIISKPLLTIITGLLFAASITISAQSMPDLKVSDIKTVYDLYSNLEPRHGWTSSQHEYASFDQRVQEVSALFENSSNKTIKAVTWEFVVYADEPRTQVIKVYTSHNKTSLLSGNSVKLVRVGYIDIGSYNEVRVIGIKYADGTFWQGTSSKK